MGNPVTKLAVKDGEVGWMRVQDVEPEIERNKTLQTETQKGDFRHIGSIPLVIWEKWMQESGVDLFKLPKDELTKFIKLKLSDPDYRWLRTDNAAKTTFMGNRFGFL